MLSRIEKFLTVNSLNTGHRRDLELVSSLARVRKIKI